jgi:hypothetical protein
VTFILITALLSGLCAEAVATPIPPGFHAGIGATGGISSATTLDEDLRSGSPFIEESFLGDQNPALIETDLAVRENDVPAEITLPRRAVIRAPEAPTAVILLTGSGCLALFVVIQGNRRGRRHAGRRRVRFEMRKMA